MIMLYSRESLFLGGRHDLTIDNQTRSGVVIEGRNAENTGHAENSV
jgi:hypothetical protein